MTAQSKDALKNRVERIRLLLLKQSRTRKKFAMAIVDSIGLATVSVISQLLVYGESYPWHYVAAVVLGSCTAATAFGFYKTIIRFVGVDLFVSALRISAVAAVFNLAAGSLVTDLIMAMRVSIAHWFIGVVWLAGSRYLARRFMNKRGRYREAVLIYGAGDGGARLVASLSASSRFYPVGFIDDDSGLFGTNVQGLQVHRPASIERVIAESGAKRVLLALPGATRRARRRIIESLEPLPVRVQTIPDVGDIISGNSRVDDIRDVAVEDLLGRDPVPPRLDLLQSEISGRVVMVTGGGGSIGSEIARQLSRHSPKALLLVESSEIALYRIGREIEELVADFERPPRIITLLGSVLDRNRMREIMQSFAVDVVYHAAAYKHVPIVERNVFEGIRNNVFGTHATALAAIETDVRKFVLISTDKAVSPTNVMGASKRLAEMVLQTFDSHQNSTRFCMVRFGNVLASSGSVVPLFREQIRQGGPVTVTHPNITRYFMTIPEAAQLVMQAGAMAKGGDVFVLDMGEPIRIVDLAEKMIRLMGLSVVNENTPDGDIEIVFSGLRPAEKLYEELLIGTDVAGTQHPRILRASEQRPSYESMQDILAALEDVIRNRDHESLRGLLVDVVEGYVPAARLEDHIVLQRKTRERSKVTELENYRS